MAENRPAVPRRISAAILNSLAAGVVPRTGLEYIAIGRTNEINALLDDFSVAENAGSAFRMIIGRYGSGKSFLLQLMRSHALERGFATVDADFSPERRLTGSRGQGLATYRELMMNLSSKAAPDGGGLPVILSRWIASLQLAAAKQNGFAPGSPELLKAVETSVLETVHGFENMVHGFDFSTAVIAYYHGVALNDEEKKKAALRWLCGDFETKTQARTHLPVSSIIDDKNWYDYLKLVSALVTAAGLKGLIVFIDEAVNLYKIIQTASREANYEKLLTIFNDATQGRLSHLAFILGGTPQFLEDTRRGLYSYEALRSRLSDNRYSAAGRQDYCAPVLRLEMLTPEELLALLKRILTIHSSHYAWEPPVTDEQLASFVLDLTGRMGADSLLTPREVVRDFTGLLNILHQHPEQSFESLVSSLDIKPADKETDVDLDFAEFEL